MAQSARSASVYFGKNVNRTRRRGMIRGAVRVIVLLVIVGIVLTPFYISLLYSIKSHSDISLNRLAWPEEPTLDNYSRVIQENKYVAIGFKNSILTTIPTTLILLFTTSMASYVLARYNSRFYKVMYSLFISGVLVPFQCIMLPLYVNIYNMGLDLEQAANIDGCGRFRTFWQIVFPLMTPINVTQLVLNTLFVWNDYSTAVVLLRDDTSRTLPLAQIIYFGENMTELNLAFAFFMLSMLPILILYLCTQRFIVAGIMSGAVKG